MLRKVLQRSAHPRQLLRSILALDDSPHAVALGVAVGIFVGLTPTVGVQTVLILALVFVCRKVCYFNGAAAMASTYVSNPFTMLPLYYFWYQLGIWFFPGSSATIDLGPLTEFNGITGWWNSMCDLGLNVGVPMFVGALITAPFGSVAAYFATYSALRRVQRKDDDTPPGSSSGDSSTGAGDTENVKRVDDAGDTVGSPRSLEGASDSAGHDSLIASV